MPKTTKKKRVKKEIPAFAHAYVTASFNNTLVTITDLGGNPLCRSSAGTAGFKGTKKATSFASTRVGLQAAEKAQKLGVKEIAVFIKGPGVGRNAAVKALKAGGLGIRSIADITPIPHDGCRPKKRRRV